MTDASEIAPASAPRSQLPVDVARHTSSYTLPPEVMMEAARRLGWLALVYCGAVAFGHFGRRALLVWNGSAGLRLQTSDAFGLAAIALGLAVFWLSRSGVLSARRLLDVGLVFQVAGALGIAATEISSGLPRMIDAPFPLLPAECVWIVVFPLVVPNTPHRVFVSALLAASMGPAVLGVAVTTAGVHIGDANVVAIYYLTSNYLCAVVAYVVARIVHRYGMRLRHLREIGSYELLEPLGQGGMGEVWRAKHRLLARPAAIKLIRCDLLGSDERSREAMVHRFEREARETATLGSTHTIDVYDFGITEDGDFYYVMELLDGISLEQFVQVHGPMEPARIVYLLRQVCHSLGEAHGRGLVHRDIKPANILMCRLGPDDDFVKVLDFGLVRHFDASAESMMTMDGITAGTPAYMAPEIALGRSDIDGRADLYSLACVAYYLLTGEPVFSAETAVATALAHVKDAPTPPGLRSEFEIPPALETLVLDCLAKDPATRPATAELLAERLASVVPSTAWTPQMARGWWDLHRMDTVRTGAAAGAAQHATTGGERLRCWPRLDRTPENRELRIANRES
jgi:serine/threonine-protein kinase